MAKEKRDIGLIQVKLRMPLALHKKLMREAEKRGQTLNAEILSRLAEYDRALSVAEDALLTAKNALEQARKIDEAVRKVEEAAAILKDKATGGGNDETRIR